MRYIKGGENGNADRLSRLNSEKSNDLIDESFDEYPYIKFIEENIGVITSDKVRQETNKDKTLLQIKKFILFGWSHVVLDDFKKYKSL